MRVGALVDRAWTEYRLRRPPQCPPGWHVGPPDFVGVGAQRSGTTWWHHLVASHPGVQRGVKELHYFHRYWRQPFGAADAARYASYFPRPAGKLTGEWSPGYLSHFWVAPLLRDAAPDARLLVLLRDPVERFHSGMQLQSATGRRGASAASAAFRLGCYALQLEELFTSFPRAQVLVLQFERCRAEPATELARTFRFLGLDEAFTPDDLLQPRNESRGAKLELSPQHRDALVAAYAPDVARLTAIIPDLTIDLWPNFRA